MKDTWILFSTAALILLVMLSGKLFRGDYTFNTDYIAPISSAAQTMAVERDGRALINLNAADAETLMMVDGIGEILSQRIILYREEHGPFLSIDDLLAIDGIGETTLKKFSDQLTCVN